MSGDPAYVLDANVFIEAARRYYAFDLAPKFWKELGHHVSAGHVQSIDRVKRELEQGKDDLAQWVSKGGFGAGFVSTSDKGVIQSYGEIMTWVQAHPQFLDGARADFAKGADGWLVAYAKGESGIVVTQEVADPNVKRRVPIPNVCQAFSVPFCDTFEMLRRLGVKFS